MYTQVHTLPLEIQLSVLDYNPFISVKADTHAGFTFCFKWRPSRWEVSYLILDLFSSCESFGFIIIVLIVK